MPPAHVLQHKRIRLVTSKQKAEAVKGFRLILLMAAG